MGGTKEILFLRSLNIFVRLFYAPFIRWSQISFLTPGIPSFAQRTYSGADINLPYVRVAEKKSFFDYEY